MYTLSGVFVVFNVFLIRTTMFCFDKLHFLLAVGDMVEQNFCRIPNLDLLVDLLTIPDIKQY